MNGVRALVVSVEYADLLSVTLPRNMQHFDECLVVTTPQDKETQRLAESCGAKWFATDAFYENGATFNKGRSLELAFDYFGRHGWLLIHDADILLPFCIPSFVPQPGKLYTPRRRMLIDQWQWQSHLVDWSHLPIRDDVAFPGYFQLFNAADPVLRARPWYGIDYTHAGGGDNVFQKRWHRRNKIRPPFEVLHLGPCDANWFGRATPRLDGAMPETAEERRAVMEQFLRSKGWGRRRENVEFREKV